MSEALTTADGRPLRESLAIAERQKRIRALLLVTPLFLFIFMSFLYPIALMLYRSVENPLIAQHMPLTVEALANWDGKDVPDEPVFAALREDLVAARESREIGKVATRMNFETPGLRSVFTGTARRAARMEPPFKEAFLKSRKEWGELETWATIKRLSPTITPVNYLAAVDRQLNVEGDVVKIGEDYQIYVDLFIRTAWMSIVVTIACLILGFPIAYLLASLPMRQSNLLMILVLLPFWTSLLVRTTSWIVLLQTQGC